VLALQDWGCVIKTGQNTLGVSHNVLENMQVGMATRQEGFRRERTILVAKCNKSVLVC